MSYFLDLVDRFDPAYPSDAAAVFLLFMVPIWFYMAWNDMAHLKIRNGLVLLVFGLFLIVGPLVLSWPLFVGQLIQAVVVFGIIVVLFMAGVMGGGDAKFIAAASPFFMREDGIMILMIALACSLGAFTTHRVFRLAGADRTTPLWRSWRSGKRFPLGFSLGAIVCLYLALAAF